MEIKLYEKMNMTLPEGFSIAEEVDVKTYFGSTLVDYAFLNEAKSAAIGIVHTENDLEEAILESQINAYQQYYSRMVPGFQMGEMRKSNKKDNNIVFMTYKSNAPNRDFYNILALTAFEGKEIVFLFSCDMLEAVNFMYKFFAVLDSIAIIDELE